MIRITMKDGGVIDIELDEKAAPLTVENFLKLVNMKFYDGTIFHRVIPGFMIQGGDPQGTGMGGPGWTIKGEFSANGVDNPISHKRGVISMARAMDPDSAGSQFFIMHADADYLDGQYAAFGHVVSGMDVVDRIAGVRTNRWAGDRPYEDQVISDVSCASIIGNAEGSLPLTINHHSGHSKAELTLDALSSAGDRFWALLKV